MQVQEAHRSQWAIAKSEMRAAATEDVYNSWFASLQFESFESGVLTLTTATDFNRHWLKNNYAEFILNSWPYDTNALNIEVRGMTREKPVIKLSAPPETPEIASVYKNPPPSEMPEPEPELALTDDGVVEFADDSLKPEDPGPFDNFWVREPLKDSTFKSVVIGADSNVAVTYVKQMVQDRFNMFPLFIHGGPGTGKTFLLDALSNDAVKNKKTVAHCSMGRLDIHGVDSFCRVAVESDLVLIDNFEAVKSNNAKFANNVKAALKSIIDAHTPLIIAAGQPPELLCSNRPKLRSYLMAGLVVEKTYESAETRAALIRKLAEPFEVQVGLPDNTIRRMAAVLPGDGHMIKGAVNQVIMHCLKNEIPRDGHVSIEMIDRLIEKYATMKYAHLLTIDDIVLTVSKYYKIGVNSIKEQSKRAEIVKARHAAMYLARTMTNRSSPELGRWFRRDHATVLNAVNRIHAKLETDPELRREIELIRRAVLE